MKRFVMLAALLAAACQPMPAIDDATDPGSGQTSASEASACAAKGGQMLPQGRMQSLQCVLSYSDAGQRCSDSDDCQGECRVDDAADAPAAGAAAVGQCQATSSRFGCYTRVEDGKAEATICVD